MGNYTEIYINFKLRSFIDRHHLNIIGYLFGDGVVKKPSEEEIEQLKHPFFRLSNWQDIGTFSKYHLPNEKRSLQFCDILKEVHVVSRSDIYNFEEAETFFDWLLECVADDSAKFIGYYLMPSSRFPTLVYKRP